MYRRHLTLFDNHVIPCRQLFYDLAVTYHVANDAQSSRSVGKERKKSLFKAIAMNFWHLKRIVYFSEVNFIETVVEEVFYF